MAEHKLSTFDQLKKLALAGKRDSAKQVAELAELVAAGLEDLCYSAGRELERRSADCCTCFPLS